MRLDCVVATERPPARPKRAVKGIVGIGKSKLKGGNGECLYQIQISTAKEKNQTPIPIGINCCERMIKTHVNDGRLTLMIKEPRINIFISNAAPPQLTRFHEEFEKINNGEDVDLATMQQVKATDLRQVTTTLRISRKDDYPSTGFPSSLTLLRMNGIGLRRVDARWFCLTHLHHLDIANNQLGAATNVQVMRNFQKLKNLQVLLMSNNGIEDLPAEVWDAFPRSLVHLDLSSNAFERFPHQLLSLRNLRFLNLSENHIKELPYELPLHLTSLVVLDVQSNMLQHLPKTLRMLNLNTLRASSNPLILPRENVILKQRSADVGLLEELAAAAVTSYKCRVDVLPKHLVPQLPYMRGLCSRCSRWVAKSTMRIELSEEVKRRRLDTFESLCFSRGVHCVQFNYSMRNLNEWHLINLTIALAQVVVSRLKRILAMQRCTPPSV